MSHITKALCAAAVAALFVGTTQAATINLEANLDGAQANAGAGTGSTKTGFATVTYDDVSNLLSWNVAWDALDSGETGAHFHGAAAPGANASVVVGIGVASNPAIGSATITELEAADLLAGLWYINIHSNAFLGGEIRGQVLVVPEPASLAVLLLGGMLVMRRRR